MTPDDRPAGNPVDITTSAAMSDSWAFRCRMVERIGARLAPEPKVIRARCRRVRWIGWEGGVTCANIGSNSVRGRSTRYGSGDGWECATAPWVSREALSCWESLPPTSPFVRSLVCSYTRRSHILAPMTKIPGFKSPFALLPGFFEGRPGRGSRVCPRQESLVAPRSPDRDQGKKRKGRSPVAVSLFVVAHPRAQIIYRVGRNTL